MKTRKRNETNQAGKQNKATTARGPAARTTKKQQHETPAGRTTRTRTKEFSLRILRIHARQRPYGVCTVGSWRTMNSVGPNAGSFTLARPSTTCQKWARCRNDIMCGGWCHCGRSRSVVSFGGLAVGEIR